MAITTYSELQTMIASWLHRDDLTSQIPDFIALIEPKISDDIRIKEIEKRATRTVLTTSRYLDLPDRFNGMRELFLTFGTAEWYLEEVTIEQMEKFRITTPGQPCQFSTWGLEMEFNRTPLAEYTVEMSYYERVLPLSDSNTSNNVLAYYPNIYLFGALTMAEPFLINDERLPMWAGLYNDAIQSANDHHMDEPNIQRMRSDKKVV